MGCESCVLASLFTINLPVALKRVPAGEGAFESRKQKDVKPKWSGG